MVLEISFLRWDMPTVFSVGHNNRILFLCTDDQKISMKVDRNIGLYFAMCREVGMVHMIYSAMYMEADMAHKFYSAHTEVCIEVHTEAQ
jgi:hypothetical protein